MDESNLKKFSIIIASVPDREHCVCEVYYERVQWCEISQETDEIMIQFFSPLEGFWEFPLEEALEVLQKAKNRFLQID